MLANELEMLVHVVDTALLQGSFKVASHSIAAKTGTAQIPDPNGKGYSDEVLHTFFSYFPAYQPRFLVVMFLDRPRGAQYAATTLSESFRAIAKFALTQLVEVTGGNL